MRKLCTPPGAAPDPALTPATFDAAAGRPQLLPAVLLADDSHSGPQIHRPALPLTGHSHSIDRLLDGLVEMTVLAAVEQWLGRQQVCLTLFMKARQQGCPLEPADCPAVRAQGSAQKLSRQAAWQATFVWGPGTS